MTFIPIETLGILIVSWIAGALLCDYLASRSYEQAEKKEFSKKDYERSEILENIGLLIAITLILGNAFMQAPEVTIILVAIYLGHLFETRRN